MKNNVRIVTRLLYTLFVGVTGLFVLMAFMVGQAQSMPDEFYQQSNPVKVYPAIVVAQSTTNTFPITVTDQTPTSPLSNPDPASFQPRYLSGFGLDDSFTVFFEDRDNDQKISFNQTTTGPTGFAATSTATNIIDTHFVVKDWPITISGTPYAYRGWGSVGNNPEHHFYVSDNLITWTLVSTFTIPNAAGFTDARGFVYYGFHDVILLNGTYYAFAEANSGQTMLVSSTLGADNWTAFDSVGGTLSTDGPLQLPESGTPSGSFVDLGHDRGSGKIHVRGNDSEFYLAINPAAKASLPPAELEAAFINPTNWMWNDGTTGLPTTQILTATTEHDLREAWVVPQTDPDADWIIIYDADFGTGDGGKALGYAGATPEKVGGGSIYLPIIFKNYYPSSDLVVTDIVVTGNAVQVVIMNQGTQSVTDDFWVDLYIDPNPPPTAANHFFGDGRSIYGIVWGVIDPIAPGQVIVLTLGDGYYWPSLSNFPDSLAGQVVLAYAHVDSVNTDSNYGGVLESHEPPGSGPTYNNIMSRIITIPVFSVVESGSTGGDNDYHQPVLPGNLPSRL